jgi:L-serine dehydratase
MTCKLLGAGDKPVYELEYYSPGGGFYEWKGYTPPKKGQPKYPYATMKELRQHAEKGHELEVQGDERSRSRPEPHALLR